MTWLHQFCIISERIRTIALLTAYKNEILESICVHNRWKVPNDDITDSGGVADLRMSMIRIYQNLKTP